jgi:hypothetical protein
VAGPAATRSTHVATGATHVTAMSASVAVMATWAMRMIGATSRAAFMLLAHN